MQESDWLLRGPHQQHHLIERLSLKGHNIRVIDFPITWQNDSNKKLLSGREVYENVSRFYSGSNVTVIRPSILKLQFFDKLSIIVSHREEIKRQIIEFKPDVILGLGILNNYYALLESRKHNIPFIYYLIDTLHRLLENNIYSEIAKYYEKFNIKNSNLILTINKQLKKYIIEMGGDPNKITVLHAGIDLNFFDKTKLDTNRIREKYGIKNSDLVLFFMGWLYQFTGILEVAKYLLINKISGIKLFVVGEGDIYPDLVKLSKSDVNNKIILTGKVPYNEIPNLVNVADICILPAYNIKVMQNIVPIKIYEYMACGKPIIATKLNGLIIEFGYDSGISYVNSIDDLFKIVTKFKENKQLIELEGNKSKNSVKDYDWINIVNSFEQILYACTKR